MTPLKVQTPLPPTVSSAALDQLLKATGLTALSATDWVIECAGGDAPGVVLVVVPDDHAAAAGLESVARAAVTRGVRVVAIWPPGAASAALPAALEDYGAALVGWDPAALHAAICGQQHEWEDAGGGRRKERELPRNKNC